MKKLISILSVFCILNASFISCKTSSLISIDEASAKAGEEKSLILHTPIKNYTLDNYEFKDDKLIGELKKKGKHKGYTVHVYTDVNHDVILKPGELQHVEISVTQIQKITYTKKTPGKAIGIGVGATAFVVLILGIIAASTFTMNS